MPLLSIYNNLIHGYMMSRQTRFDSHKRSELSEIHNRIRKISSEQPLYKIDFDADAQEYALSVKEHAMELAAAIKDMGSDESEGAFSRFIIKSDHPEFIWGEDNLSTCTSKSSIFPGSDPSSTSTPTIPG